MRPEPALRQAVLGAWLCALSVLALSASAPGPAVAPAPTAAAAPAPTPGSSSAARALLEGRPLDLNRASASELELLPGIGPRLAERIVRDRTTRGPFRSVSELKRVPGVGKGKLRAVRALLGAAWPPASSIVE
jgi:competence protein ComEA